MRLGMKERQIKYRNWINQKAIPTLKTNIESN